MPKPRRSASAVALATLAAIAAAGSGCATRTVRETFYEDAATRIVLRSQTQSGEAVERGFGHPMSVAPVRVAHILSRIDVRIEAKKGAQRAPALPTEALYVVADHLSKAFRQADSTQEIAAYSIRRAKRFGIFDRRFLTSFVTYVEDDMLYIHLSRVDWEIPKSGTKAERLPEPRVGDYVMKFRVVPSEGMTQVDGQSVAVNWRDPLFKKPTRTRITPSGKVMRRTILMESGEEGGEAAEEPGFVRLPEDLSSATLRKLADLEDERHRGEISEAEYNTRRREIIRSDPAAR
jgi:hypothetical protein